MDNHSRCMDVTVNPCNDGTVDIHTRPTVYPLTVGSSLRSGGTYARYNASAGYSYASTGLLLASRGYSPSPPAEARTPLGWVRMCVGGWVLEGGHGQQ